MRVFICGMEIRRWDQLGLLNLLSGLRNSAYLCACGTCFGEEVQPLSPHCIPKTDIFFFCNAVDGLFHAAELINFSYQAQLLGYCLATEQLVSAFRRWSAHVSQSSNHPVTVLSAFLLNGQTRCILPALARAVLNDCEEFCLADRVHFCTVHDYQPLVTVIY